MRKFTLLLVFMTLFVMALAGCSSQGEQQQATTETSDTSASTETAAAVEEWPTQPVEIVVPFNAGGDTDFHARTYAKYLEPILGQPVVVVNVSGANGSAGTIQVRDSDPDGYTALFFHDSMLMNKVVGVTDFAQESLDVVAAGVMDNSYILAVNANSPYQSLDDLIQAAKEAPGDITYASSVGGYTYYVGRQIEELTGVDFNIVDAGGGTDRNAALLAGKIDTNVNPYGVMKPYIDSGDFRVLAVFSEARSSLFPDVPTAVEQGYNIIAQRAYFLSFPKGTDQAIIDKMAAAMEEVSQMPEYAEDIKTAYCVEPSYKNTADVKAYLDGRLAEFEDAAAMILGE
jgi:tripartite-type tricarboxylate transporter receptor subunit TctC